MKQIDQRIAELPPEKLALLLERLGQLGTAGKTPSGPRPIRRRRWDSDRRPLSFAQERLWFLDQLSPIGSEYNVPAALRLRGGVDRRAVAQALAEVVRRHEVLRAGFSAVDGAPVQTIAREVYLVPTSIDLRGLDRARREPEAFRLARRMALRGFDLTRPPLLRACWIELEGDDQILLLVLHHIVCDGWSVEIFTREIVELYRAFSAGGKSPLPELPVQYADYAEWQREELQGGRLEELLSYWRRQLQGAPATVAFRGVLPDGPDREHRGVDEHFAIPPEVAAALASLGREEGATPFVSLAALLATLLYTESGQEEVCLGANSGHRGGVETEGLIGFFVNQVVLRLRLPPAGSFRHLVRHVRDVTAEGFAHQDLPFERLVDALRPNRATGRNSLFQVKVDFQESAAPVQIPGLEISDLEIVDTPLRCDLLLMGARVGGEIHCTLSYDSGRFSAGSVRTMAARLVRLAALASAEPDLSLGALSQQVAQEVERERSEERERLDRLGAKKLAKTRRKGLRLDGSG